MTLIDFDPRDFAQLEKAVDSLERLHDEQAIGNVLVRHCLCQEAASWRQARQILNAYAPMMGLRRSLLDRS